jgi:hypothetical protein
MWDHSSHPAANGDSNALNIAKRTGELFRGLVPKKGDALRRIAHPVSLWRTDTKQASHPKFDQISRDLNENRAGEFLYLL